MITQSAPVVAFDHSSPFARWYLIALLTWPKNTRQQAYALVTYASQQIAYWEQHGPALASQTFDATIKGVSKRLGVSEADVLSMPQAREIAEHLRQHVSNQRAIIETEVFRPAGGYQSVADAPGARVLRAEAEKALMGGAKNAGRILFLIATMDRRHPDLSPSLNRAIAVIEAISRSNSAQGISDRTLKDQWGEWRGVAPLSAALWVWIAADPLRQPLDDRLTSAFQTELGIKSVLRWAKWFRKFGTSFRAKNGSGVLLPEEETFQYQTNVPVLEPNWQPLSSVELEAAKRYHAATLKSGY